jgi:hypothetical protein
VAIELKMMTFASWCEWNFYPSFHYGEGCYQDCWEQLDSPMRSEMLMHYEKQMMSVEAVTM